MPLTDAQRAGLRPQLPALRERCASLAPPERVREIRATLEALGATPDWDEWEAFVVEELGAPAPELGRPTG